MTDREDLIRDVRCSYKAKAGRKKGLIFRSYDGMEVGIRTFNYDVISSKGLFSGYWTDPRPTWSERTIISRILASKDCQEWDTLDEKELIAVCRFLQEVIGAKGGEQRFESVIPKRHIRKGCHNVQGK